MEVTLTVLGKMDRTLGYDYGDIIAYMPDKKRMINHDRQKTND